MDVLEEAKEIKKELDVEKHLRFMDWN